MANFKSFALLLIFALLLPAQEGNRGLAVHVARERRVALVIGNGAYPASPLKNPPNDARAISVALQDCGFKVQTLVDATLPEMESALRTFGQELKAGGVGLFYYAGHGMQVKGTNYLIPIGAQITEEDEVRFKALDADQVLAKLESAANGLNLMILDACRNDPFGRSWHRGGPGGLAQMDAPTGTYIAFATAPGKTASDGVGEHGLYTQHLLRALQQPGLKVEEVFKQVRVGVRQASRDQQVPWDISSLSGEFYFRPGQRVGTAPMPVGGPDGSPSLGMARPGGTDGPPTSRLTGGLQVAVVGTEAKVFLDSEFKGVAKPEQPLNLQDLLPGEVRLRAEAQGYLPARRVVQIETGKWNQVALPMKKGLKVVVYRKPNRLQWRDSKFQVIVDNRLMATLGNHDAVCLEIPAGETTLKVINPVRDSVIGILRAQTQLADSSKGSQFFRIDAGMSMVLTEVDEDTWKRESKKFESNEIEPIP